MKRLSINLELPDAPGAQAPIFLNHMHCGRQDFFNALTVSGVNYYPNDLNGAGYLDANAELVDPLPAGATAYYVLVQGQGHGIGLTYDANVSGIAMKCTWDGGAAISGITKQGDIASLTVNLAERYCTWTYGATGTDAVQGGNYTQAGVLVFSFDTGVSTEPPTNIKVFKAEHEARVIAGEIFDPDWLSQISNFSPLRVMGAMQTNFAVVVDYTDFATESYVYWGETADGLTYGRKTGLPLTVIAKLADAAESDIWVCLPHKATDACVTSIATAMRDGVTNQSLKIFFEFHNETWNYYKQYMIDQADAMPGTPWSADGGYDRGQKWCGYRGAQMMELVRTVFGTDSGAGRWVGVIGTWNGVSYALSNLKLPGIDYHIANDAGATQDITKLYTHVAVAPYIGPKAITANGAQAHVVTIGEWIDESISRDDDYAYANEQFYNAIKLSAPADGDWENLAAVRSWWQNNMTIATSRGLTTIMYEGAYGSQCVNPLADNLNGDWGQETQGAKFNYFFSQWAETEYCALLEASMWDTWIADGGLYPDKFASFALNGKSGPWGFKQWFDDPCPRGKGAISWSRGSAYPALRYRLTAS